MFDLFVGSLTLIASFFEIGFKRVLGIENIILAEVGMLMEVAFSENTTFYFGYMNIAVGTIRTLLVGTDPSNVISGIKDSCSCVMEHCSQNKIFMISASVPCQLMEKKCFNELMRKSKAIDGLRLLHFVKKKLYSPHPHNKLHKKALIVYTQQVSVTQRIFFLNKPHCCLHDSEDKFRPTT